MNAHEIEKEQVEKYRLLALQALSDPNWQPEDVWRVLISDLSRSFYTREAWSYIAGAVGGRPELRQNREASIRWLEEFRWG